jgi:hypothetical protein
MELGLAGQKSINVRQHNCGPALQKHTTSGQRHNIAAIVCVQDALTGGQGYVRRVAESGQLLLDRVAHADVLEWLWMLTSFSTELYR